MCLSNMYPGPHDPDFGAFVKDMEEALEDRGHHVEPVVINTRKAGRLRTPAKYLGLTGRALAAARRADVIYSHFLFPTGAIAATAARLTRTPWVVTAHGQDVANLSNPVLCAVTARALAQRCGGLIAVSQYLADRMATHLDELPPTQIINMGVDVSRFVPGDRSEARRALRIPDTGPIVLAVGGLTTRKDPLTLLQAVARLRETTHPDVRLAFVGDGHLAGAVDVGAERLGLGRAVIRPGAVPHDQVHAWMAASNVLSMVSRIEPLGVVALEALACGRPVVATVRGGAHEVVPARGAGRVVEPGDPVAIAGALASLLDAPPTPGDCRAVAARHRLSLQAERVEGVLMRAITGPEDTTLV